MLPTDMADRLAESTIDAFEKARAARRALEDEMDRRGAVAAQRHALAQRQHLTWFGRLLWRLMFRDEAAR